MLSSHEEDPMQVRDLRRAHSNSNSNSYHSTGNRNPYGSRNNSSNNLSSTSPASARTLSSAEFETQSKSSRGSRISTTLSEATPKTHNNGPSPTSILLPPGMNTPAKSRSSGPAAVSASPKSSKNGFFNRPSASGVTGDAKIASYVVKLKDETARLQSQRAGTNSKMEVVDTRRLTDILTKIRMLLDARVEQGNKEPLSRDIPLGASVVEVMRQYPAGHDLLMEECTCVLYFISIIEPDFKKGVARLFKAMGDHKSNVAIQRASCEAIRNVVQANPDALSRIAPSLGVILQSMAAHGNNNKLIFKSLELLADLALEPASKPLFVQKGGVGLLHILSAMNRHAADSTIQAAGCRSICNLSLGASREVLQRLTPSLDVILRAMNRHDKDKYVQLYGTWALGNLAGWHHAEIVHQGGVDVILPTLRERLADVRLQEQGLCALSKLIDAAKDAETRAKYVDAICLQDGIQAILQSLNHHAGTQGVQIQGLNVLLGCVAHSLDHHEIFLAEGGLDVMLRALTTFENNIDVATKGMEVLKNFTRQSLDFQRAVYAKGGIGVLVGLMKIHRQAHSVQDPAFACLRNIAIHPENRETVAQQGAIPVMVANMQIYLGDAAIQAYGCDALGRLATDQEAIQVMILENEALQAALMAMVTHPNHPGVQDRAIFFMLQMTAHAQGVELLRNLNAMATIAHARIPQKPASLERCEQLIGSLEAKSWFKRR